ncbi:hypothetical protein C8F04DRAFT_1177036 [Mycena alexandri]|uniref:Secreted protein n=1 Tax=Mycena alexandri TaxID=1745969 RepID=A0AAD6TAP6_9AGAR|nr:hypothetical protein C8F04DRAFT_1177036 [Mycena alexandri]
MWKASPPLSSVSIFILALASEVAAQVSLDTRKRLRHSNTPRPSGVEGGNRQGCSRPFPAGRKGFGRLRANYRYSEPSNIRTQFDSSGGAVTLATIHISGSRCY